MPPPATGRAPAPQPTRRRAPGALATLAALALVSSVTALASLTALSTQVAAPAAADVAADDPAAGALGAERPGTMVGVYGAQTAIAPPKVLGDLGVRPRAIGAGGVADGPPATFVVNYSGFTPQAQAAFQAAVDIWASKITSPVPITVNASFTSLPFAAQLGQAGPGTFRRDFPGAPQANTWYPEALANALAGVNLSPAVPEIVAELNSTFSLGFCAPNCWYFGVDGNPPSNQFDFESVVLHELGHGLGFTGSLDATGGGTCCQGSAQFFVFDTFTQRGDGTPLTSLCCPSAALVTALTSNDTFFSGTFTNAAGGGQRARLHAPNPWQSGTSYAHLDEATYTAGSPNALMTPTLFNDEVNHDPGPVTLGIFRDMGWQMATPPAFPPGPPATVVASPGVESASVNWTPPASDGGSPLTGYRLTTNPVGTQITFDAATTSTTVTGLVGGTSYSFSVAAINAMGTGTATTSNSVVPSSVPGTRFHPVVPFRVLDSRTAVGGWAFAKLGPNQTRDLVVTTGAVPAAATAVVANITVTQGTAGSFVTGFPKGAGQPNASNVNFAAGQTTSNLATIKVGSSGSLTFFNAAGSVHIVVDIVGYYDDGTVAGDEFRPITPVRKLDSRTTTGGWASTPLGQGAVNDLTVTGGSVPSTATAVVMNVTVTQGTRNSFATVYPTGAAQPTSSNVNFAAGETKPNLVTVGVGTSGRVRFFNQLGSVHIVADVLGYYDPAPGGGRFHALSPTRVLDSRNGIGGFTTPWGMFGDNERDVTVGGTFGIPLAATAVVANVTVDNASMPSFLTIFADGVAQPSTSNNLFGPGPPVPNLAVSQLATSGRLTIVNQQGSVDVIADVAGYFAPT